MIFNFENLKFLVLIALLGSCSSLELEQKQNINVQILDKSQLDGCIYLYNTSATETGYDPADATNKALKTLKRQAFVTEGNAIHIKNVYSSKYYSYEYDYTADQSNVNVDVYKCEFITKRDAFLKQTTN